MIAVEFQDIHTRKGYPWRSFPFIPRKIISRPLRLSSQRTQSYFLSGEISPPEKKLYLCVLCGLCERQDLCAVGSVRKAIFCSP